MRYVAAVAFLALTTFCLAENDRNTPVGRWHNDGKPTPFQIWLNADGTGEWIAPPGHRLTWSYDPVSGVIMAHLESAPEGRPRGMSFSYDPDADTLMLLGESGSESNKHTLRRERVLQGGDDEDVDLATLPQEVRDRVVSIRPGSTRAQVRKYFRPDGGLSVPLTQRYYLPDFSVGPKLVMIEIRYDSEKSDIVRRVSMPFLSSLAID